MNEEEFKNLIYPLTHEHVADLTGYKQDTIDKYASGHLKVSKRFKNILTRRQVLLAYRYNRRESEVSRYKSGLKKKDKRALKLRDELK